MDGPPPLFFMGYTDNDNNDKDCRWSLSLSHVVLGYFFTPGGSLKAISDARSVERDVAVILFVLFFSFYVCAYEYITIT